jgi:hypothetical protein
MSEVTNTDIMVAIARIEEKVDTVTTLAKHTNGRVTRLEAKQLQAEAVETYKKEQPVIQHADSVVVRQEQHWYLNPTLVTAVAALLTAVAGYIGFVAGGK